MNLPSDPDLEQRLRADAAREPAPVLRADFTQRVLDGCRQPAPLPRENIRPAAAWALAAALALAVISTWRPSTTTLPQAAQTATAMLSTPAVPAPEALASLADEPFRREWNALRDDVTTATEIARALADGLGSLASL